MGVVRRVLEARLREAVVAELQRRQLRYQTFSPHVLLVEVCKVLDAWKITEDAGNNRSKSGLVELLQETIGNADGEAYCMSTVQTQTALVEAILGKRSNLPATEGCMDAWRQSKASGLLVLQPMSLAVHEGDVAVWQHIGSDRGHTGRVCVVKPEGRFTCFEGNTSGAPGIDRDGGGCYMKERDRAMHGSMMLVGFIREQFA